MRRITLSGPGHTQDTLIGINFLAIGWVSKALAFWILLATPDQGPDCAIICVYAHPYMPVAQDACPLAPRGYSVIHRDNPGITCIQVNPYAISNPLVCKKAV
jgi:hypothetical protein